MCALCATVTIGLAPVAAGVASAVPAENVAVFESGAVRPLALSPDGSRLFVANQPDGRLEVVDLDGPGMQVVGSVPVGVEPVAVAARSDDEVWVVNHLSDSVSVVSVADAPRVMATLLVGDEPSDIVFGGPGRRYAFVTTAHRGQTSPVDSAPFDPDAGRADVWVFDTTTLAAGSATQPLAILTFFGAAPRALAVSPDGGTVYAAVFRSGNRTTVVNRAFICDGGVGSGPCPIGEGLTAPGDKPPPERNHEGIFAPDTSLIVRWSDDAAAFVDELGRDWNDALPYRLPDCDVARIDATVHPPRIDDGCVSGVGNVLFSMAVHPQTGDLFVANTEARNEVRFEPNVRGDFVRSRVSVVSGETVVASELNGASATRGAGAPASAVLATPVAVAFDATGDRLFVAGLGSGNIASLPANAVATGDAPGDEALFFPVAGGGPTGLVFDSPRDRLYTLSKFASRVVAIEPETGAELDRVELFDPEPVAVREGRRFLYAIDEGGAGGESSCAGCHVFGHTDGLAWDLGDVGGDVTTRELPTIDRFGVLRFEPVTFHPMKGPLLTQTFRGMSTHGPMHWRGDRVGSDPFDARAAFRAFNPAFVSLLGHAQPLAEEDLERFVDFALSLRTPPNPLRRLDDSLTEEQELGRVHFETFSQQQDKPLPCAGCHLVDRDLGVFGTTGLIQNDPTERNQGMKIPHLRALYERVGFLNIDPECGIECDPRPLVRGFGFNPSGDSPLTEFPDITAETLAYIGALPTETAPMVGQQWTLAASPDATELDRLESMRMRAAAGDCELVVHARDSGRSRGWVGIDGSRFRSDRAGEEWSYVRLLAHAEATGNETTWTCVPPGTGERIGVDRDFDGARDGDERDAGSRTTDHRSLPLSRGSLSVRANRLPAGDERLRLGGRFPNRVLQIDPSAVGLTVELRDGVGSLLATATYPAGEHWSTSESGKTFVYRSGAAKVRWKEGGARARTRLKVRDRGDFRVPPDTVDPTVIVRAGGFDVERHWRSEGAATNCRFFGRERLDCRH